MLMYHRTARQTITVQDNLLIGLEHNSCRYLHDSLTFWTLKLKLRIMMRSLRRCSALLPPSGHTYFVSHKNYSGWSPSAEKRSTKKPKVHTIISFTQRTVTLIIEIWAMWRGKESLLKMTLCGNKCNLLWRFQVPRKTANIINQTDRCLKVGLRWLEQSQ